MVNKATEQPDISSMSRSDLKKMKKIIEDKQVKLFFEKEELSKRANEIRRVINGLHGIAPVGSDKELQSLNAAYKEKSDEFRANMDLLTSIEALLNEKEVGVSIGISRVGDLCMFVFNVGATVFMCKGGLKRIPINLRNIFVKKFR